MASATGMPRVPPNSGEEEPLLGAPGDVRQRDEPLLNNVYLGTGILAQAGIWLLVAVTWAAVFGTKLQLFSAHPLLNSAGLLIVTQAILVLQPTHTAHQKHAGTLAHATLHGAGLTALVAGLIVIEVNKFRGGGAHFGHPHNILGLIAYILLALQACVGVAQYWVQGVFGGEDNAKKLWKYHRAGGYATLVVSLATVCAAPWTSFNLTTLHIKSWTVIVPSVLVLLGVVPRIKLQKLGLKQ